MNPNPMTRNPTDSETPGSMPSRQDPIGPMRRRLTGNVRWGVTCGLVCAAGAGCADPAAEMNQIRRQFEQIPAQADRRMVAFVLGLPYAETADRSAWLYFIPRPVLPRPARPQRMILVRFDEKDRCVFRELLVWRRPGASRVQLYHELSWANPQRPTDNDYWTILQEKLRELAQAGTAYQLDSQPASYQLRAGEQLLVGMQRWEQGEFRLLRLTAELADASHPRLAEAIELSCRVRILSVGIEFDRPLVQELR